ncbi:MAG: hypothetical protein AB2A00_35550 [Myxococcota bacterium]
MRKTRRGAGIATVLVVSALVLTLGFTLAASSFMHLNVSTQVVNAQHARELAESVVAAGIQNVVESSGAYGRDDNPSFSLPVEVSLQGLPPGSTGRLVFDPAEARRMGIPYSTNRFERTGRPGWGGRIVPEDCIHLVGTGSCNGVVRSVEVVLQVPRYPYALAANGPIRSSGRILVGTVTLTQASTPGEGIVGVDPDELLPGHLASNATDNDSVRLALDSLITGNLRSRGGVVLDPTVQVRGQVRANGDSSPVPRVTIPSLDPGPRALPLPPVVEPDPEAPIVGERRAVGPVTVNGDLLMAQAVIYIDGDLTVQGGLIGQGLVACTGRIRIDGGTTLDGGNQAALLAGEGVELIGRGAASSSFQGIVYSEGELLADQISVLGAAVVNGDGTEGVTLRDAAAGHVPEYTRLNMSLPNAYARAIPDSSNAMVTMFAGPRRRGEPFQPTTFKIVPSQLYVNAVLKKPGDPPGTDYSRTFSNWAQAEPFARDIVVWYQGYYNGLGPGGGQMVRILQGFLDEFPTPSDTWGDANLPTVASNDFTFDINEFLSFGDRLRVRFWREF